MTLFDWQADQIEMAAKMLAHTLEHTAADRLDWKPAADPKSETRSAIQQVQECIRVNATMATLLIGGTPDQDAPEPPSESKAAQAP